MVVPFIKYGFSFFDVGLDFIQFVEVETLMNIVIRQATIAERLECALAAMEKAHDIA
jgi:hypothetical protein